MYAYPLLSELEEIYGKIDTKILLPKNTSIDIAFFEAIHKTILNELEGILKKEDQKEYEGMIEFVKSLKENIDFSKRKRDSNGYKYQYDKVRELLTWIKNFETKVYKLGDDVSISLTPSNFFHILFGHVEGYLVPRKGGAVRFVNVYSCAQLLEFIDQFVEFLKSEIIVHYKVESNHFERRNVLFMGSRFGIHIKQRRIETVYPVSEYLSQKYSTKD